MQATLIAAVAAHVLFGVFWSGTTFALARTGGVSAVKLFRPQMGAAIIAMLSGGYLWKLTHAGVFELAEQTLAIGVLCAFAAAIVQAGLAGPALRKIRAVPLDDAAQRRIAIAYRISAALLAITLLAMASARFL